MFTHKDVFYLFVAGLAASYITNVMTLRKRDSHEGPFIDESKRVVIQEDSVPHFQKFSLFDRIRNLFGIYERDNDLYYVKGGWKTEAFTCELCLSQWVSHLFSFPYFLHKRDLFKTFSLHFSIAAFSSLINYLMGFLLNNRST